MWVGVSVNFCFFSIQCIMLFIYKLKPQLELGYHVAKPTNQRKQAQQALARSSFFFSAIIRLHIAAAAAVVQLHSSWMCSSGFPIIFMAANQNYCKSAAWPDATPTDHALRSSSSSSTVDITNF